MKKTFMCDLEWGGPVMRSGIWYRSFDLNKFITECEAKTGRKVVGLHFEDNNVELLMGEE